MNIPKLNREYSIQLALCPVHVDLGCFLVTYVHEFVSHIFHVFFSYLSIFLVDPEQVNFDWLVNYSNLRAVEKCNENTY